MTTDNILHSAVSPDWLTPMPYVNAARATMGRIDLDPQSSFEAQSRIRAAKFFTPKDDCFQHPWHGNVFLNPSGEITRKSWRYLLAEIEAGRTTQAVWLGYSLQQLQTLQTDGPGPLRAAMLICICDHRIKFDVTVADRMRLQAALDAKNDAAGKPREVWKNAPTHGNYFAYFGPNESAFIHHFAQFGEIR